MYLMYNQDCGYDKINKFFEIMFNLKELFLYLVCNFCFVCALRSLSLAYIV